jgi:hypothetical protein
MPAQGLRRAVKLSNGAGLPCELAVVAVGIRPNSALAKGAGLRIGALGGIEVAELLATSDPDIYAAGGCIEVAHRITGRKVHAPHGDLGNLQGRVAGSTGLGYQCVGPGGVSRQIAQAAVAMLGDFMVTDAINADLPCATPFSLAIDNSIAPAQVLKNRLDGRMEGISAMEVKERVNRGEKLCILDLRGPDEYGAMRLGIGEKLIPLGASRGRLSELLRDQMLPHRFPSRLRSCPAPRGAGVSRRQGDGGRHSRLAVPTGEARGEVA